MEILMNNKQLIESLEYYTQRINEVTIGYWQKKAVNSLPNRRLAQYTYWAQTQNGQDKDYKVISKLNRRRERAEELAKLNIGKGTRLANTIQTAADNSLGYKHRLLGRNYNRNNFDPRDKETNQKVRDVVKKTQDDIKRDPVLAKLISANHKIVDTIKDWGD